MVFKRLICAHLPGRDRLGPIRAIHHPTRGEHRGSLIELKLIPDLEVHPSPYISVISRVRAAISRSVSEPTFFPIRALLMVRI